MAKERTIRQALKANYFNWLYDRILPTRETSLQWLQLSLYLHENWMFYWSVDYDENRSEDGRALREYFLLESEGSYPTYEMDNFLRGDVSVFEVLVALCERMDYQMDYHGNNLYLELLTNLGLDRYYDGNFVGYEDEIDEAVVIFLDRKYDRYGNGSLFPIVSHVTDLDMRVTELWYQMMEYIEGR